MDDNIQMLFLDTFQHNDAASHTTGIVLELLEEQEEDITLLSWTINVPDFNPIEHISGQLEHVIRTSTSQQFRSYQVNCCQYCSISRGHIRTCH